MELLLIIIVSLIILFIIYKIIKPYVIKYDNTIAFTGGLGSGKTLNAVKIAIVLLRKNKIKVKIINTFRSIKSKITRKELKILETPQIYSNIPICINKRKKIYSNKITKEHLLLKEHITEYSIVFIDELPQMINQFNWNITEVQNNVNEFITFFRHYIGGYFITTAQSIDDIVSQIRRKLNSYFWLYDFKKFWFIYRVRICNLQTSDLITTTSTTFIEDNTKKKWGIIKKGVYDSRCFSERYKRITTINNKKFHKLKTNKIIRFDNKYISPLDNEKD